MPTIPCRPLTPSMRPALYAAEGRASLRARNLAHASGARLRRATARAGGDEGLALASALIDMILAGSSCVGWPVAELIALLSRELPGRDRQVAKLLAALRRIEADVALVLDEVDDGGMEPASTSRAA